MRKTRGVLFVLVGLLLAGLAGYAVLSYAKQAADNAEVNAKANAAAAAATAVASIQATPTPIPKVYVVVATDDLAPNVAITELDVAQKEIPADFAPLDAIASTDIAVGKYTTSQIFRGQILVAPLLTATRPPQSFAEKVPPGKVAMSVVVGDAMDDIGALHPGDRVDILLSLDLKQLADLATPTTNQPSAAPNGPNAVPTEVELSTQLTMQNVEILAIGAPPALATVVSGRPQVTPTGSPVAEGTPTTGTPVAGTPEAGAPVLGGALSGAQATGTPGTATPVATGTPAGTPVPTGTATPQSQQDLRTITFLLDRQDAVTLKFIKDSGGTMDLVVRSTADEKLAPQTEAVTLDTIFRKFSFRFVQPVQVSAQGNQPSH
jgi:Flp pilus assembly protein CpaB